MKASPSLVVKSGGGLMLLWTQGCELESRHRILNVQCSNLLLSITLLKRPKIKEKRQWMALEKNLFFAKALTLDQSVDHRIVPLPIPKSTSHLKRRPTRASPLSRSSRRQTECRRRSCSTFPTRPEAPSKTLGPSRAGRAPKNIYS